MDCYKRSSAIPLVIFFVASIKVMATENDMKKHPSTIKQRQDNDRLIPKPFAPNKLPQHDETLHQKLEELKNDRTGKPWKTAYDSLINPGVSNNEIC